MMRRNSAFHSCDIITLMIDTFYWFTFKNEKKENKGCCAFPSSFCRSSNLHFFYIKSLYIYYYVRYHWYKMLSSKHVSYLKAHHDVRVKSELINVSKWYFSIFRCFVHIYMKVFLMSVVWGFYAGTLWNAVCQLAHSWCRRESLALMMKMMIPAVRQMSPTERHTTGPEASGFTGRAGGEQSNNLNIDIQRAFITKL